MAERYLYELEGRRERTTFTVGGRHRPPVSDELLLMMTYGYRDPIGLLLDRAEVAKLRDALSVWLETGWPGVPISHPAVPEGGELQRATKQDRSCPRSPGGDKSQSDESSQDIT